MSLAANDAPLPRIKATRCSQCGLTVRGMPHQTNRLHLPKSVPTDRAAQCGRSGDPRGDVLLAGTPVSGRSGRSERSERSERIGAHPHATDQQIAWTSCRRARGQARLVNAARASTAPVVGAIATSPR